MVEDGKPREEAGFAVLAAVIGLGALALIASSAILISSLGVSAGSLALLQSQAQAFADAILMQAALALQDARSDMRPRVDGVSTDMQVLEKRVTIVVEDEFGKVDLNAAPQITLSKLFQSTGLSAGVADDLSNRLDAFRRNGMPSLETDLQVAHANRPRLFRLSNELLLVPGITRELLLATEPAFTTASGRDVIDTSVAPDAALRAVDGVAQAEAQQMMNVLTSSTLSDNSQGVTTAGRVRPGIDQRGWPFRVRSSFIFQGMKFNLDGTIRLTGGAPPGYVVMGYRFSACRNICAN